jgi:hypothetical protein
MKTYLKLICKSLLANINASLYLRNFFLLAMQTFGGKDILSIPFKPEHQLILPASNAAFFGIEGEISARMRDSSPRLQVSFFQQFRSNIGGSRSQCHIGQ